MPTSLTAAELRMLCAMADASDYFELRDKLALMIAEASSVRQWGAKVFEWRLPLSVDVMRVRGKNAGKRVKVALCPTLNVFARLDPGQRAQLQKHLDPLILAELHKWPDWRHRGRGRAVRVTRYSSMPPDEVAADSIGAKAPLDRLVAAGVLRGDSAADLQREAAWQKAKPGHGCLLLEVHDLATKA